MASKALGDLTAASALSGAEEVYIVQSGNSRKSTAQAIANLGTSQDNMTDGTTNKNYTATEQTRLANTSGTNTGDQTTITGNAGTATKLATARNIDGQSFDGTADVTIMAPGTHAAASKTTPVDADEFPLVDSAASFGLKKLTWANFKATLKSYTDTLYLSTTLARREVLTASRTYYVATTGSDSNDGLTSGTAFLTTQKAVNVVLGLDLSTYNVTIQVADGTYTGSTSVNAPFVGSGTVTIRGNPTTPANCLINPATGGFYGSNGARFSLSGFKLTPGAAAIQADGIGTIITLTGSMEYGAAGTNHMAVTSGGTITVLANYTISGSAQVHWNADGLSVINCLGRTITLTGTLAFGPCFALCAQISFIRCYSCTFTGAATGQRYNVQYNAGIHTNGGGESYLPGSVNGTVANGGFYR